MEFVPQPRVLVVDPDPSIRTLVAAVLRQHRAVTTCVSDAYSALACAHSASYDAVVIEPRMDGGEALLHDLCADPRERKPKIIVATTSDRFASAIAHPNVDAVLLKPFDLDELASLFA